MNKTANHETSNDEMLAAVIETFGSTPETVEGRAELVNLALSAGDAVMAASVVFDHARDLRIPWTTLDPQASNIFPYPDLTPLGNQGLAQFMEALDHLGLKLAVTPS